MPTAVQAYLIGIENSELSRTLTFSNEVNAERYSAVRIMVFTIRHTSCGNFVSKLRSDGFDSSIFKKKKIRLWKCNVFYFKQQSSEQRNKHTHVLVNTYRMYILDVTS